ncbi:hypothetical protein FCG67_00795 [Rhodococcus oryzae]|uniref:Leucine rich repeat variant domain-containing protein n=1 Tax=Rhodococcus oryzae TaxID=2571143 RepID=A0ABY2RQ76_9NOCA|nr:DUF5336 domain-containing protein [Rhodococcus oryzae]TJZ81227.1 hypothetical protein FCG67_00795 [Rhodococcus oryzae]
MSNAPFAAPIAGPPVPAVGRPNALGIAVLTLGLLNLLLGFGPYFVVRTSGDVINISGFLLPQALLVVVFLLFSGISAGLSTVSRLSQFPGAAPVLRAIATAAAAVGALLALFLLIAISNVPTFTGNFFDDSDDESLAVSLGWGGIAILVLSILQTVAAFLALAYDLGLVQPRAARVLDLGAGLPPAPAEHLDAEVPGTPPPALGSPAPTKPYTQALALDPYTPLQTLGHIAQSDAALRPYVAANPSAYPDLLDWLAELGDPEVDAALKARPDRTEAKPGDETTDKDADAPADKDKGEADKSAKQSTDKAAQKVEAP